MTTADGGVPTMTGRQPGGPKRNVFSPRAAIATVALRKSAPMMIVGSRMVCADCVSVSGVAGPLDLFTDIILLSISAFTL